MRERIYTLVEKAQTEDRLSRLYDWYIMAVAIASVVPMMSRESYPLLKTLETVTVYLLFLDYILRWMTYDYHCKKHTPWSFVVYPVTPMAIMDILGILPTIGLLPQSFMILRLLRLGKICQYSDSCRRVANVFQKQKRVLISVMTIAIAYIFISALIMFVHEPPDNFPTFYDALYWATTALTTVGYGDIYPKTEVGKLISMVSSVFGVAVIAMPAGIVTAGFMDELNHDLERKEEKKEDAKGGDGENEQ